MREKTAVHYPDREPIQDWKLLVIVTNNDVVHIEHDGITAREAVVLLHRIADQFESSTRDLEH